MEKSSQISGLSIDQILKFAEEVFKSPCLQVFKSSPWLLPSTALILTIVKELYQHRERFAKEVFKSSEPQVLNSQPITTQNQPAESIISNFDRRQEIAAYYYKDFNSTIFDNKLPADLPVKWNRRLWKIAGYCRTMLGIPRQAYIVLSYKFLDTEDRIRKTLLHEMCHAAEWILDGCNLSPTHEGRFKYWVEQARQKRPDLPPVTVYHDYQMRTRYNYRCLQCQNNVGRNTLSICEGIRACSKCGGRFQLLEHGEPVSEEVPEVKTTCSNSGRTRSRPARLRSRSTLRRNRSRPARSRGRSVATRRTTRQRTYPRQVRVTLSPLSTGHGRLPAGQKVAPPSAGQGHALSLAGQGRASKSKNHGPPQGGQGGRKVSNGRARSSTHNTFTRHAASGFSVTRNS